MTYYINGWRESEKYFKSFLTEDEYNRCINGEVIIKNGNEFFVR